MEKNKDISLDNYDKPFPKRLRELLEGKNSPLKHRVNQKELSENVGTSRQVISLYCNGNTSPNVEAITKIAQYFNVSSDYLLGLSDTPSTSEDCKTVEKVTGLSDKSIKVLSSWNASQDNNFEFGTRDLRALNALLEGIYDAMEQNPGIIINTIFSEIGLYLYGEFEHHTETSNPLDQSILNDPIFQTNSDTLYISEKGKKVGIAYDVNKIMGAYVLENITNFIRKLKEEE